MKISLVVPVYNEEETIPIFYQTVRNYKELQPYDIEIVFINDGSQDKTEELINHYAKNDTLVLPLSFTRNFGKEAALMAGLTYATGDAIIPIDVDLQDPIEDTQQHNQRTDRSTDSFLKRETAKWFYTINNQITDLKIEENVGDFRLLDRSIVNHIKEMPERNLFMKGILSWVGGKTVIVPYKRNKRIAGHTKFNRIKLWRTAMEGITSFSTRLLHVWMYIGMLIATCSLLYGTYRIISKLIFGNDVPGYTSLMVVISFIGGIQLIGIGILGQYIGKIYIETKQRPRYILKEIPKQNNNLE